MIGTPVFVALGSNLGDREAALAFAVTALGAIEGVRVLAVTPALETEPLGGLPQPAYLNAMALLDVTCTPHELLAACQRIERQAGRRARTRWASRELDLDIVRFGDVVSEEPALRLPHPGLADRAFWIRQLEELEARVDGETRLSMPGLVGLKREGRRLVMLTCYDALFARLLEQAGIDLLLVGDSVNEVLAGRRSTLSATLDQMIYHAASVRRGTDRALVVVDLPFLAYQVSVEEAIRHAGRILAETDCHAVKLEGGRVMVPTVAALTARGIPVVAHLGLTPQSIHGLGGYRVQGRSPADADRLRADALALQEAGASAIVLELLPQGLAREISASLTIPTIGIGSGAGCDGQVLVLHDMLGLNEGFAPKFLRHYAELAGVVRDAAGRYADEVRAGEYPGPDHAFD